MPPSSLICIVDSSKKLGKGVSLPIAKDNERGSYKGRLSFMNNWQRSYFIKLLKQEILFNNFLLYKNKRNTSHKWQMWNGIFTVNLNLVTKLVLAKILLCLSSSMKLTVFELPQHNKLLLDFIPVFFGGGWGGGKSNRTIDLMRWRHPAIILEVNDVETIKTYRFVCPAHRFGQWWAAFWHLSEGALLIWRHVNKVYGMINQGGLLQIISIYLSSALVVTTEIPFLFGSFLTFCLTLNRSLHTGDE